MYDKIFTNDPSIVTFPILVTKNLHNYISGMLHFKDKYAYFFAGSKASRDYYNMTYMQSVDTLKFSIVQTICPIMTAKPTSTVHVPSEP